MCTSESHPTDTTHTRHTCCDSHDTVTDACLWEIGDTTATTVVVQRDQRGTVVVIEAGGELADLGSAWWPPLDFVPSQAREQARLLIEAAGVAERRGAMVVA